MKRTTFALLTAVTAASLLTGCGIFEKRKDTEYMKSVQERPLEVPPDLTTPNSSAALTIPTVHATAGTTAAATGGAAPSATPSALPPAAPGVTLGGTGLQVADTLDSTWARVGLALERSGAATILSRDEAAHAYTVETTGQVASNPGWFKRAVTLGRAGGKTTAKVQLTVRVSADGEKSTVNVEGGTDAASQDAARALLATLRERLS